MLCRHVLNLMAFALFAFILTGDAQAGTPTWKAGTTKPRSRPNNRSGWQATPAATMRPRHTPRSVDQSAGRSNRPMANG